MNTHTLYTQTSLSIHSSVIEKLHTLSAESGLTISEIIIYCLARYTQEVKIKLNVEGLSTYQPRCGMYKALPIKLPQTLYEKGFDLRKSLKLSLSFIFAIAFMAYLDDLTNSPVIVHSPEIAYSYKESLYTAVHFCKNGKNFFIYRWDKPPE